MENKEKVFTSLIKDNSRSEVFSSTFIELVKAESCFFFSRVSYAQPWWYPKAIPPQPHHILRDVSIEDKQTCLLYCVIIKEIGCWLLYHIPACQTFTLSTPALQNWLWDVKIGETAAPTSSLGIVSLPQWPVTKCSCLRSWKENTSKIV